MNWILTKVKWNLRTPNRQTHNVLKRSPEGHPRDLLRISSKKGTQEVALGRPWDVKFECSRDIRSRRLQDIRWERSWDSQIGYLEDLLRTFEMYVLGTSLEPIFAGWVTVLPWNERLFYHFQRSSWSLMFRNKLWSRWYCSVKIIWCSTKSMINGENHRPLTMIEKAWLGVWH